MSGHKISAENFFENPYAHYRRLRESDPVHQQADGEWILTRYEDVAMVVGDPRFGRQPSGGVNPFTTEERAATPLDDMLSRWMVFMDPPAHTRLRRLFRGWFTVDAIQKLKPVIRDIANGLLDAKSNSGAMEFIGDFAYPLPILVICRLMGIPPADRDIFRADFAALTRAIDTGTASDIADAAPVADRMTEYFKFLAQERRQRPCDDIVSGLVAETGKPDGLDEAELLANCAFLLWAGHETTKNLIGNGLFTLLRNPEQWRLLKERPELIDSTVEEMLRFESPIQKLLRWAGEEIVIGGHTIAPGSMIGAIIGAAHRDPERYDDPDRFDITRPVRTHLAFGRGLHHCLGITLARVEAQIAFSCLGERLHDVELQSPVFWRHLKAIRGLESLPISFSDSGPGTKSC